MAQLQRTVTINPGASEHYGQLAVSGIKHQDGSTVRIEKFLGVVFHSPAPVVAADFWASTSPWVEITPTIKSQLIDATTFEITAELHFASPYVITPADVLTFGINGNLVADPARWTSSFILVADAIPDINGIVAIQVPPAPDPHLKDQQQTIVFTRRDRPQTVEVPLNATTEFALSPGTYHVAAADLTTLAETVVAAAEVTPKTIEVKTGERVTVHVHYSNVRTYSAINVVFEDYGVLRGEKLHVTITMGSSTIANFTTEVGHTTELRRLPIGTAGHVHVTPVTLNNVRYIFDTKEVSLKPALHTVTYGRADITGELVDDTGFVPLYITVTTSVSLDTVIPVRLELISRHRPLQPTDLIYTQPVLAQAGSTAFGVPVSPGVYRVKVKNFIKNGILYMVKAVSQLTVASDGSTVLALTLEEGPHLHVRGFPHFLSFGGCADLTPGNQADFVYARTSAPFKYAGNDGAGDGGVFLPDDPATRRTIQLARDIEKELDDGRRVLPVMVSYTCNLSLGDTKTQLQNATRLGHSFGNFILALTIAKGKIDEKHPVPAGFVVNPDFLGACQQENIPPSYEMPVREPLTVALEHHSIAHAIPDAISNTLKGYVLAVNWLVRTVAPEVTFGWQINLWGVGRADWIYQAEIDPADMARLTVTYIHGMGVYDTHVVGTSAPDFMAIDRYEADDLTQRAYVNGYCYGPRDWSRFFDYCAAISLQLKQPVMPWQIPASRLPLVTDPVSDDFNPQHWGTGGSYILGDPDVDGDYHRVHARVLALEFSPAFPLMGRKFEDVFIRSLPFDLSSPAYTDFLLRGIFSVLLGGGATTGVISTVGNPEGWVRDKLRQYMAHPIRM